MGLGDLALFAALPMIGSRLTILMAQCLAVPVAMWFSPRRVAAWALTALYGGGLEIAQTLAGTGREGSPVNRIWADCAPSSAALMIPPAYPAPSPTG